MPVLQFHFLSVSFPVSSSSPNPPNCTYQRSSGSSLKTSHRDTLLLEVPKADLKRKPVLHYPSSNNSNLHTDQTLGLSHPSFRYTIVVYECSSFRPKHRKKPVTAHDINILFFAYPPPVRRVWSGPFAPAFIARVLIRPPSTFLVNTQPDILWSAGPSNYTTEELRGK